MASSRGSYVDCNGCNAHITGMYWSCCNCADFKYCEECGIYKDLMHRPGHSFIQKSLGNQSPSRTVFDFPPEWAMDNLTSVRRYPVPTEGMEYSMVAGKFSATLPQARIMQIERIQNVYHWESYYLKRKQLVIKAGSRSNINEKDLFHGTDPNFVGVICKDNFDFRLAGERIGALLGNGTYFARDAKYSNGYSTPDSHGKRYMFVAKVLCGNYCKGEKGYKRPPRLNDRHSDLYDCCVDSVNNPSIFCLFDNSQFYPSYLIQYKYP